MKELTSVEQLERRLRWLMLLRVITTTALLSTTIVVQFRQSGGGADDALTALYALIGFIYFLTFIYAVVLPRLAGILVQAHVQIGGDILITTCVIYLTGGMESVFSFMYILAVINAGILLKMRGALITASLSSISYGALLDLHYYRYITPYLTRFYYFDFFRPSDVLNMILVNMAAYYLVAFLTGYLSRQLEESRIKLRESQHDLERLEDLNESIVQSIDSGLITLSDRGDIHSFNFAAERITGLALGQVRGRHYKWLFPDLDISIPSHREPAATTAINYTYQRPDGEYLFLNIEPLGLRDRDGKTWGRLLVFKDDTHLKRMEDEVKRVEKLAAVGEMAAGIAHEIRNPLASMSGSLQLLEHDLQGDEPSGRLMTILRREMDRLNLIVTDFLQFARPRSGNLVVIDLTEALEDILRMFSPRIDQEAKIRIETHFTNRLHIWFDENQFDQIIWNLLRNAVESMPEGGVLRLSTRLLEEQPPFAVVAIMDTGIGIADEDLKCIFDPFFTTKDGGSGLGLSIVFRILENHGGRIEVKSEKNGGTTFQVYLPLAEDGSPAA